MSDDVLNNAEEVVETVEVEQDELVENEEILDEETLEEGDEAELHVCPLCVSPLEEALDEEALLEHLNVVVTLIDRLTQINEGEEDVEDVIHNTVADLLLGEDEE